MTKPVLYSYFRSTASWRVRIALAFKGIEYDYKAVHLVKDGGQQHTDEYKCLNPMRQVPTLCIDGLTLTQSVPIIEYLEETRSELPRLLPKDAASRAQVRRIAEIINSGIQPVQNLSVLQKLKEVVPKDEKDAASKEWGHYWIHRGFQALEAILQQTSGQYCVGDEITMADVFLVPQHGNATRFEVDMTEFPIIQRIVNELVKQDAFKKAHFNCQPDTPEELRPKD